MLFRVKHINLKLLSFKIQLTYRYTSLHNEGVLESVVYCIP